MMKTYDLKYILFVIAVIAVNTVRADTDNIEIYKDYVFAAGVGAAIVKFDTKIKFTDKQSGDSIFLDPEGNLDLPETSSVTTFYGRYRFNSRHSMGFSLFSVNRESSVFDIDKTFENVSVVGDATMTDTTDFYQLDYGYTLFDDERSNIKLIAGIYSLDLKYVFEAEGSITMDDVISTGTLVKESSVFAPLPVVGLDFWFSITPRWSLATRVGFVTGSYKDLSATVLQSGINAQYKFNRNVGGVIGLVNFDADVTIDKSDETQDIGYSYDGLFLGVHIIY